MSDEIAQAFAHPEARSTADPADRLSLRDHVVAAEIGAFEDERGVPQRLRFNVVVEVARAKAADDVDRILSYDKLTEAIATELAGERVDLLETLAERIAARILAEPKAERVFLRIEKLDRGDYTLGVEILRSGQAAATPTDTRPSVRVAHVDNSAFDKLCGLRDGLGEGAVVYVVGPPPLLRRHAAGTEADARIALLGIDQNAIHLADRMTGIQVATTRTELDWAIRNAPACVWAPSRMILGAASRPEALEGGALAQWLAAEIGAAPPSTVQAPPPSHPLAEIHEPEPDPGLPVGFLRPLAGSSWIGFSTFRGIARDLPDEVYDLISAPRAPLFGRPLDTPQIMGILNVTPDSFSDGGADASLAEAIARGQVMAGQADILDIGGESTRPGAAEVPVAEEITRVVPVIEGLRAAGVTTPISIDTRKAPVAEAALEAGADMVNDVSAGLFDPDMLPLVAARGVPICLLHAKGDPQTMQADPRYDDVVAEVHAHLARRIAAAEEAGIARGNIIADPGIGFGKTLQHNVTLIRRLAAFHSLGVALLFGASRKRFIGTLGGTEEASRRLGGSLAVALAAADRGAHVIRVHDPFETREALRLHIALLKDEAP